MSTTYTRSEARAYDRHCMDVLRIPGIVLMRNAAAGCAALAESMCARDARVTVVCGAGQNGGDGYGVAAMLAERGMRVRVLALGKPQDGSDAAVMRAEAIARGVPIELFPGAGDGGDLVVDALFGTGLDRPLDGEALAAVRWINASRARVLSIDLPSGMDCDLGCGLPECVRADVTATMVARKRGFDAPGADAWTGRVVVVPIGGPSPDALRGRVADA